MVMAKIDNCITTKKVRIGLLLPSDIATSCKLTVRRILKSSRNNDINRLYSITSGKNVQIDEIVEKAIQSKPKNLKSSCDKRLAVKREESVWDRFMKLKKENCVIKALEHEVSKYRIKDWQLVSSSLPKNVFAFCRRGLNTSSTNQREHVLMENGKLQPMPALPSGTSSIAYSLYV